MSNSEAVLNQDVIDRVQQSFKQVVPIADQVGPMFYARLFQTHPETRPMFDADIAPQAKKLVQMLALVVNSLHRLDTILPAVEALAVNRRESVTLPVTEISTVWPADRRRNPAPLHTRASRPGRMPSRPLPATSTASTTL